MKELIEIFPWNKNFETGIQLIDEQHHTIVDLINQIASQMVHNPDPYSLEEVFSELKAYTQYHFETEEGIWAQYLSEHKIFKKHQQSHQHFIQSVIALKQETTSKSLQQVFEDVLVFLTNWLARHILESDMLLSKVISIIQSGIPEDEAFTIAERKMKDSVNIILNTTLSMYETLCKRTIELHREILHRKKVEEKLRLASSVFNHTLEAICILDINNIIVDANSTFFDTTGYQHDEVIGKKITELKSGLQDKALIDSIWQALTTHSTWHGEIQSRNKKGELHSEWLSLSTIKDQQQNIINAIGIFSNISSLINNQLELERLAHHDALTKLPNRLLLADRLEQSISRAQRNKEKFAVCFIDLDGFKPINDNYGHVTGDQILCKIAKRLKHVIRGNDTVARLGGDEFVTIFNELHNINNYKEQVHRLLAEISKPINIQDKRFQISASIGIAIYPDHGDTPEKLLLHSDQAMYKAKNTGKSKYLVYA